MSSFEREYMREGRNPFQHAPALKWLLIAVAGSFLAVLVVPRLLPIVGVRLGYPDLLAWLGFTPQHGLGSLYLWQLVTYPFLQNPGEILHVLFDCLFLYWFGQAVEERYGSQKLLAIFFLAGVFGALCYALVSWGGGAASGAGPGVCALLMIYTLHYPRQKVLFFFLVEMPQWLFTVIVAAVYLSAFLNGVGGRATALGGGLFGWLFFRYHGRLEAYLRRLDRRIERKEQQKAREIDQRVDELLDKINREGMAALTKKERDFLNRASKRYQGRG